MYIVYTDAYGIGLCRKRTTLLARSKIHIMLYHITYSIVYGSYTLCSQQNVPLNVSAGWHWIEMGFLVK